MKNREPTCEIEIIGYLKSVSKALPSRRIGVCVFAFFVVACLQVRIEILAQLHNYVFPEPYSIEWAKEEDWYIQDRLVLYDG